MVKRPKQSTDDLHDELVIKAIASTDRRRILDALQEQPLTTGALCTLLPWLNRCTVMQHLGVLEKAGLIFSQKRGRERWNYLDVAPLQQVHERWIKPIAQPGARLLHRLKQDIESA